MVSRFILTVINSLKIVKTSIYKIPPDLPCLRRSASRRQAFPKEGTAVQSRITCSKAGIGTLAPDGITPLWQSRYDSKPRGATCLREAPPPKASCGGQALRRRQGGDFPMFMSIQF